MGKAKVKTKKESRPTYTVEKVLDATRWGRTLWYLVKWQGYSEEDNSWVKHRDILDKSLVQTPQVLSMLAKTKPKKKKKSLSLHITVQAESIEDFAKILLSLKGSVLQDN